MKPLGLGMEKLQGTEATTTGMRHFSLAEYKSHRRMEVVSTQAAATATAERTMSLVVVGPSTTLAE